VLYVFFRIGDVGNQMVPFGMEDFRQGLGGAVSLN
jgi:hypothetical protein